MSNKVFLIFSFYIYHFFFYIIYYQRAAQSIFHEKKKSQYLKPAVKPGKWDEKQHTFKNNIEAVEFLLI